MSKLVIPSDAAQPTPADKSDPAPTEAQLHAEMLHHLTLLRQFADEAQVKFCLAQESFNESDRLAKSNLVVAPSATASAALLGAAGKPVDKQVAGRIVRGQDPAQSRKIREAAEMFDVQAKACLRGIFSHAQRLGVCVGLKVSIEEEGA